MVDDRRAETVAKTLYDRYFSVFGFPRRLMSDNAPGVWRKSDHSLV